MKTRTLMACFVAVVFSAGLLGCSVSLSGSASLSSDGTTAILKGQDPLEVRAEQPKAPEPPPPPPPKPKKAGPLLLGGTIAYSTGTAITLVDNLKIETKRELKYRKERKDGVLPGQILDSEIEKLQEIEQRMAKPAGQTGRP